MATIRGPSRSSVFLSACGADFVPDEEAALVGVVVDSASGTPVPRAAVRAVWQARFVRLNGGFTFRTEQHEANTDDSGRYRICGLPRDTPLLVYAGRGAPSGIASKVRVPPGASVAELRLQLGTP